MTDLEMLTSFVLFYLVSSFPPDISNCAEMLKKGFSNFQLNTWQSFTLQQRGCTIKILNVWNEWNWDFWTMISLYTYSCCMLPVTLISKLWKSQLNIYPARVPLMLVTWLYGEQVIIYNLHEKSRFQKGTAIHCSFKLRTRI